MTGPERLSRELSSRAEGVGGHPISFDEVKRSANRIKWQRRAGGGAVAAAVLAVAVPVGLTVTGPNRDQGNPPVATSSPTVTRGTPAPTQLPRFHKVPLVPEEGMGGDPQIPYVFHDQIVLPTGETVKPKLRLSGVAVAGDGYVVQGTDSSGRLFVLRLDGRGEVTSKEPTSGTSFVMSADGTQLAYATEGKIVVEWAGGRRELSTDAADSVDVVGLSGSGPCVDPESEAGNGCLVLWNDQASGKAMMSDSHGIVDGALGFKKVYGLSPSGDVSGVISTTDSGSCSAVRTSDGKQLWKTCDYTLGRFSPDGKYVIGKPAYLDGPGDGLVAVLDAKTGDPIVQFDAPAQSIIHDTVWESDSSLLTLVSHNGWSLRRLSLDGHVGNVGGGSLAGDPDIVPLYFSARP